MPPKQIDVAIIGGGMVGASLAAALSGTGVTVMLVEGTAPGSSAQPSFDDRTTALGNSSRRIFQSLGMWARLAPDAAAIRAIHVSDAGRFGFARLVAAEQGNRSVRLRNTQQGHRRRAVGEAPERKRRSPARAGPTRAN